MTFAPLLPPTIAIATRKSELALIQSRMIQQAVEDVLGSSQYTPAPKVELLPMLSTGDKITDRHLLEVGGKGLFTKEIEAALMSGEAQLAMHSLKDMPAEMPEGLMIGAVLPREDFRDALISVNPDVRALGDIPHGATIGTSSPRRAAQLMRARPDLTITTFRGNVPTRVQKLHDGEADATILACAGLKRLNMAQHISAALEPEIMLPAIGQGIVAIQCREDDTAMREVLAQVNHVPSWQQMLAERAILREIEGDCHTPLAGLAQHGADGTLHVKGMIFSDDGRNMAMAEATGMASDAEALGAEVGRALKARSGEVW